MVANIEQIAERLGAKVVGQVPDTGAGAFGAARLAQCVESLQARLVPGQGKRAGRPSDASWVRHPKVPMSDATRLRLAQLAEQMSTAERKVSPMQIAAQIPGRRTVGCPRALSGILLGYSARQAATTLSPPPVPATSPRPSGTLGRAVQAGMKKAGLAS